MNEITIPYHLAIPSIICIVGLVLILLYRKMLFTEDKTFWTAVTVFLVIYLFFVGGAASEDIYYQWKLSRYDLDEDGVFGGAENTKDMRETMDKLADDVGRNFSFVTGFVKAFIVSIIVYTIGRLVPNSRRERHNN